MCTLSCVCRIARSRRHARVFFLFVRVVATLAAGRQLILGLPVRACVVVSVTAA